MISCIDGLPQSAFHRDLLADIYNFLHYFTVIRSITYSQFLTMSSFKVPYITLHGASYVLTWRISYRNGSMCVGNRSYRLLLEALPVIVFVTKYCWSLSIHISFVCYVYHQLYFSLFGTFCVIFCLSFMSQHNLRPLTFISIARMGPLNGVHVYSVYVQDYSHRNSCLILYKIILFNLNSHLTVHKHRARQKH